MTRKEGRIQRVKRYERLFDEAAVSHDPEMLRLLETCYTEQRPDCL